MGPTGSGKSTVSLKTFSHIVSTHLEAQFINTISGSELMVGFGLKSMTTAVDKSKTFDFYGKRVTLIDTL